MGAGGLEGQEGYSNQKKANKVYKTVESCGELGWWSAFLCICSWPYASVHGLMHLFMVLCVANIFSFLIVHLSLSTSCFFRGRHR